MNKKELSMIMNIDDIPEHVLHAVRQRLGADNENDDSYDDQIKNMSPEDIVCEYSGWKLGDSEWGRDFIEIYKILAGIDD